MGGKALPLGGPPPPPPLPPGVKSKGPSPAGGLRYPGLFLFWKRGLGLPVISDRDTGIDIDMDIDSDMAVSRNWMSFKRGFGLL